MEALVTKAFAEQCLSFPSRVDRILATVRDAEDIKAPLDQAVTLQNYAKRIKAGVELERPIAVGVLKLKAKLGEMLPAGKVGAGRGNKIDKPLVDFSEPTIVAYRKLAKHQEMLDAYVETCDDVPTQTGFISWAGAGNSAHVSRNTGMPEWYTPAEYLDAARSVMGSITFDPASSAVAQERVQADEFCTVEDDGLTFDWHGNVWMNPPYTVGLVDKFCDKLVEHYSAGEVKQAIVFVNNSTDTRWWQLLGSSSSAICFPQGRVKFLDPDGNPGAPLQGQSLLYLGKKTKQFCKAFRQFGIVVEVPA